MAIQISKMENYHEALTLLLNAENILEVLICEIFIFHSLRLVLEK